MWAYSSALRPGQQLGKNLHCVADISRSWLADLQRADRSVTVDHPGGAVTSEIADWICAFVGFGHEPILDAMPEGHVIHRLARELNAAFGGREVAVSSPQGRFSVEAAQLNAQVLVEAQAWGKHLLIDFDLPGEAVVHIHLGLIGKLRIEPIDQPKGVVRLRINDERMAADLHGPQWCRLITHDERAKVVADQGPDPLRADADLDRGWLRIKRSSRPIAALLMDQRIAAGVGNIYRAEVLFRCGLDPMTPGSELRPVTWRRIWDDLVLTMATGARDGRIDTVRPEHEPENMGRPPREDAHGGEVYVYRRADQNCLVCGTKIRSADLSGRNLYWCPKCQRKKK